MSVCPSDVALVAPIDPVCLRCRETIPPVRIRVMAFVSRPGDEFPRVLTGRVVCQAHDYLFTEEEAARAELEYQRRIHELCSFHLVVELLGSPADAKARVMCSCCPETVRVTALVTPASEGDRARGHDSELRAAVEVSIGQEVLRDRWTTRADVEVATRDAMAYVAHAHHVTRDDYGVTTWDRRIA